MPETFISSRQVSKSTDIEADKASNIKFPVVKAVYDWAVGLFTQGSGNANKLAKFSASKTIADSNISDDGTDITFNAKTISGFTGKIITVSGTTLTLSATHHGCLLLFTNAAGCAVTCPTGLGAGFNCSWKQATGAGQITFSAGASATLENRQSHTKSYAAKAMGSLVCFESSVFTLGGDTAA